MACPRPKQQPQENPSDFSKDSVNLNIHHVNPWERESDALTSIRKVLILAEQMGINTLTDESSLASSLASLPSCKLTSVQKDISAKRKSLFETNNKLAASKQEKATADLMHLDTVEQSINMIKELCGDLNSVLKNKDELIKTLQTPFVGDYLKIEVTYHKHVVDTFNLLVSTLNEVSHHLDNLIWIANQDMSSSVTEPLLGEIQSLTASLQTSYQTLKQMRRGMKQLKQNSQLTSSPPHQVSSQIQR